MAQFDVHANPNARMRRAIPYLVELQSDMLRDSPRRVVAPLVAAEALRERHGRLNPIFEVGGDQVVLLPQEIASVRREELRTPVGSLAAHRTEIVQALDLQFTGV